MPGNRKDKGSCRNGQAGDEGADRPWTLRRQVVCPILSGAGRAGVGSAALGCAPGCPVCDALRLAAETPGAPGRLLLRWISWPGLPKGTSFGGCATGVPSGGYGARQDSARPRRASNLRGPTAKGLSQAQSSGSAEVGCAGYRAGGRSACCGAGGAEAADDGFGAVPGVALEGADAGVPGAGQVAGREADHPGRSTRSAPAGPAVPAHRQRAAVPPGATRVAAPSRRA